MTNRNIDNDIVLLSNVKKLYDKDCEEKTLRWHLESLGYSQTEITGAIADYYWIHIRTKELVDKYLVPVNIACITIILIIYLIK
jgi:hypothetical protein